MAHTPLTIEDVSISSHESKLCTRAQAVDQVIMKSVVFSDRNTLWIPCFFGFSCRSQYNVFIFTMSEYLQLKYNNYRTYYIHTIYIYTYYIISMFSDLRLCHHCVSGLSTHLLRTRKVTWHNSHSGGGKPLGNPCWPWGVPHSHHSRSLGSFSSSPFCMVSKLL